MKFLTFLFVGLLVVVLFAWIIVPRGNEREQESSPVESKYDGFFLKAVGENMVYVTVLSKEPRAYIKGLSNALDTVEKSGGKKVLRIQTTGSPPATIFYLEENPESK